jgi:hypothetical protein
MTSETFKGIFGRDSEGDRKELGRIERIKSGVATDCPLRHKTLNQPKEPQHTPTNNSICMQRFVAG